MMSHIFLHFLNRDTQEIYGENYSNDRITYERFRKGLNAAVLLCSTDTYCFLPLGFWFESDFTRQLLINSKEYIENGYIRFSLRESSIDEYVEKKCEQYYTLCNADKKYANFYDIQIISQLMKLHPILLDRSTQIGEFCSELWNNSHEQLLLDNSGELLMIYSRIKERKDWEKIAKVVREAAADPLSPFVWKKVKDLLKELSVRDKQLVKELRFYFEKNYYKAYLKEYGAVNLYQFYLVDHGIDFQLKMPEESIANYQWFEHFLEQLDLRELLDAQAKEIVRIKRSPLGSMLLAQYQKVCNAYENFNIGCTMMMQDEEWDMMNETAKLIRQELKKKNEEVAMSYSVNMEKIDVLIMIATMEEERAIIDSGKDKWKKQCLDSGYEYYVRKEGMVFALARSVNMGRESGATAAAYYITKLEPRFLAMAGFCAGDSESVNLGDVIVPYKIYLYGDNAGKQVSETVKYPEINAYNLDDLWKQKVERFGNSWRNSVDVSRPITLQSQLYYYYKIMVSNEYKVDIRVLKDDKRLPDIIKIIKMDIDNELVKLVKENVEATEKGKKIYNDKYYLDYSDGYQDPELKVKIGVLATGDMVQQWDGIFEELKRDYDRKTCVLDMEGSALASVARFNHIPFIIAKGVGDFASGRKKFDNRYIDYAVFSAYRFLVAFFNDLSELECLNR